MAMTNIAALSHAYDLMGAACEQRWLQENRKSNYSSQFLDEGYFVQEIPVDLVEPLKQFISDEIALPFSAADARDDYWSSDLDENTQAHLNRECIYYGPPSKTAIAAMEQALASMSGEIERQLAHHWKVVNVRAWTAAPGGQLGPNAWHTDGYARYVRKIMLYLNPPNLENGTIEIMTRRGTVMTGEAANPSCVLLDSAILKHRGLPGIRQGRPAIEVTLIPGSATSTGYIYAGQNARFPKNPPNDMSSQQPVQSSENALSLEPAKLAAHPGHYGASLAPDDYNAAGKLNIGGGPLFKHSGWLNLEGVQSPRNPFPFTFSPSSIFPIPSSSLQLVYSSHCLEHLDDATVAQALKEARRVLGSEGLLLLKLPDFEYTRQRWRSGDHSFFEKWGLESINNTWSSRNVPDNIDMRAAMIFCGFWNSAYGDHFSGIHNRDGDAYHGPPPQAVSLFRELMELDSIHEVSKILCDLVRKNEESYTFNHQNAWGKDELVSLLDQTGFRAISFDRDDLVQRYENIPEISAMFDVSVYCLAEPV